MLSAQKHVCERNGQTKIEIRFVSASLMYELGIFAKSTIVSAMSDKILIFLYRIKWLSRQLAWYNKFALSQRMYFSSNPIKFNLFFTNSSLVFSNIP